MVKKAYLYIIIIKQTIKVKQMKKLNSHIKGNISTALYQIGPNSWRVSQSYLGDTPKQLSVDYLLTLERAQQEFDKLTK